MTTSVCPSSVEDTMPSSMASNRSNTAMDSDMFCAWPAKSVFQYSKRVKSWCEEREISLFPASNSEMMGMVAGLMELLEWESMEVVGLKERVEWEVMEVVGWMEKLDWKKAWWFVKGQQTLPGRWQVQKPV